jgi:hypothetical protein
LLEIRSRKSSNQMPNNRARANPYPMDPATWAALGSLKPDPVIILSSDALTGLICSTTPCQEHLPTIPK